MSYPINRKVFDSRDLIQYRDEIAEDIVNLYNDYMTEIDEDWEDLDDIDEVNLDEADFVEANEDEVEEYIAIRNFCDDISRDCSDFEWGTSIIHEDYFEDYCRELVEDIGDLPKNLPTYIENNIDWSGVADDLKVDYSEAEYNGDTYYFR
jgi:hypothetical protein